MTDEAKNERSSALRGTLYVLGGACAYVAANIMLPHDWRSWLCFGGGLVGNSCVLWRAYIDRSHARLSPDKLITGPQEPVAVEVTNTESNPVPVK